MTILTRRNAVLGWVVWEGAKRTAKFKAKRAAGVGPSSRVKAATLAGVAAAGGVLIFWKKKSSSEPGLIEE
jgi:hypothetical protein